MPAIIEGRSAKKGTGMDMQTYLSYPLYMALYTIKVILILYFNRYLQTITVNVPKQI